MKRSRSYLKDASTTVALIEQRVDSPASLAEGVHEALRSIEMPPVRWR